MTETTDTIDERWLPIPDYEELYSASDHGRICSHHPRHKGHKKILSPSTQKDGYIQLSLSKDKKRRSFLVHSLVLLAFKGQRPPNHIANHIDFDRGNNRPENLEYLTILENVRHSRDRYPRGERKFFAKLTTQQVIEIRNLYGTMSQKRASELYPVSSNHIRNIWRRKKWAHLP